MDIIDAAKWLNDNIIWGIPMLLLFTAVGLIFTFQLKLFQLRKFPYILKNTLFSSQKTSDNVGISPLRALTASLGTTLGTGNIIAVGAAVAMGGAGAVFWMWVASLLGMITCYAENYLGNRYRTASPDSETSGVPFNYIKKAFGGGKAGRLAAGVFAVCCIGASLGMGNMAQINSAGAVLKLSMNVPFWATGILCFAAALFLCSGGLKKLSSFTAKVIPAITVAYLCGCFAVIAFNCERLPTALGMIFSEAFSFEAAAAGTGTAVILNAMQWGVKRGVFSNEAGLGTSVIINAGSTAQSGKIQGMWAMLQVFIDTVVMCTMTALCILCSGAAKVSSDGIDLAFIAFRSGLGDFAGIFLAVSVMLFALTTAAGWYLYGKACLSYLTGGRGLKIYYAVFVLLCFLGAVIKPDAVWELSDLFNGIMAVPNLISLILLRKEIKT